MYAKVKMVLLDPKTFKCHHNLRKRMYTELAPQLSTHTPHSHRQTHSAQRKKNDST